MFVEKFDLCVNEKQASANPRVGQLTQSPNNVKAIKVVCGFAIKVWDCDCLCLDDSKRLQSRPYNWGFGSKIFQIRATHKFNHQKMNIGSWLWLKMSCHDSKKRFWYKLNVLCLKARIKPKKNFPSNFRASNGQQLRMSQKMKKKIMRNTWDKFILLMKQGLTVLNFVHRCN